MTVQEAILIAMEDVLGLKQSEMKAHLDLDLVENAILDSLGIVTLINEVEEHIGHKIYIKKIPSQEFSTINRMTAAIEKQLHP